MDDPMSIDDGSTNVDDPMHTDHDPEPGRESGTRAGTKRKADGLPTDRPEPRRIRALAADVVNRIAAGEIIIAPVNALKELAENCVDAGATSIDVIVKDGGLKLLQITDNGCGIRRDDLPILCHRHTTSKLSEFKDLESITSYGFRGEALASVSHIAHLSVTTRTADSDLAWRANYLDGNLVSAKPGQSAEPKTVAGRPGTQITVEDMFYNIPIRRKAFRSPAEEYNKIIDMLGRYAIHCEGVGFTCKKHGEASMGLSVPAAAKVVDRIRQIYGSTVANELVRFETSSDQWAFDADGWATNANYHVKKMSLLLFINHRCVESPSIKKGIEQLYAAYLPKGGRPFVYLNLVVNPAYLDVNVHPTKRLVGLVNEDEVVRELCEHLGRKLAAVDSSRTFLTQTLLPGTNKTGRGGGDGEWDGNADVDADADGAGDDRATTARTQGPPEGKRPRRNSNNLVRTDATSRKITSMFTSAAPGQGGSDDVFSTPETFAYRTTSRQRDPCKLMSINNLRRDERNDAHMPLCEVMAGHTFVGTVDEQRRIAAIQGGTTLYLVNYALVAEAFFYQVGLAEFMNFGTIELQQPLDLRELLRTGADLRLESLPEADRFDREEVVERTRKMLIERREMLAECFIMGISASGELLTLPMLIKNYLPPMVKLPAFLLNLGLMVDWAEEEACFRSFLHQLAFWYTPEQLPPIPGESEGRRAESVPESIKERRRRLRWSIEHVLFPAFKARMFVTKTLADKGALLAVAELPEMYKQFERC